MKTNVKLPGDTGLQAGDGDDQGRDYQADQAPAAEEIAERIVTFPVSEKVKAKAKAAKGASPFARAATRTPRLKIFLYGDTGTLKTRTALQFPAPAVLDLEGGTELYSDEFEFSVFPASTADEVMQAVDWLRANEHPWRTLVVDPITLYWDMLQRKWSDIYMLRRRGGKGHKHEFYDLQPSDWGTIKSEHKLLNRKLFELDMHLVLTAHQKVLYSDGGGGNFMEKTGLTFDGEKRLPYLFDIVVRCFRTENGEHMAEVIKDRTNKLPAKPFPLSYQTVFEAAFGKQELERPVTRPKLATPAQKKAITAQLVRLGISSEAAERGFERYDATSVEELSRDVAKEILETLKGKEPK